MKTLRTSWILSIAATLVFSVACSEKKNDQRTEPEIAVEVPNDGDGKASSKTLIAISPDELNLTIPLGVSAENTITATYSNSDSEPVTADVELEVLDPTVATVEWKDGKVTVNALKVGETSVKATYMAKQVLFSVVVSDAKIVDIKLTQEVDGTLPIGQFRQLSVLGTFTDGSELDVTEQSALSIEDDFVSLDEGAKVKGLKKGNAKVKAEYLDKASELNIVVTDAVPSSLEVDTSALAGGIPIGLSKEVKVNLIYSDNSSVDVSEDASHSGGAARASVAFTDGKLLITALTKGSANITFNFTPDNSSEVFTKSISFSVVDAVVTGLEYSDKPAAGYEFMAGKTAELSVKALLSDGSKTPLSSDVTFSPDSVGLGLISHKTTDGGNYSFKALAEGEFDLSARYQKGAIDVSASTRIKLTPSAVYRVQLTSAAGRTLLVGSTFPFTLEGTKFTGEKTSEIPAEVTVISSDPTTIEVTDTNEFIVHKATTTSSVKITVEGLTVPGAIASELYVSAVDANGFGLDLGKFAWMPGPFKLTVGSRVNLLPFATTQSGSMNVELDPYFLSDLSVTGGAQLDGYKLKVTEAGSISVSAKVNGQDVSLALTATENQTLGSISLNGTTLQGSGTMNNISFSEYNPPSQQRAGLIEFHGTSLKHESYVKYNLYQITPSGRYPRIQNASFYDVGHGATIEGFVNGASLSTENVLEVWVSGPEGELFRREYHFRKN